LQNRDPEMYDLPTGHYVGRMWYLYDTWVL
jgi:hypothetical protein